MADMTEVVEAITQGFISLKQPKVPAPPVFKGQQEGVCIDSFFTRFEKFCKSLYKEDQDAWVQVLPEYLEGEAKSLALSFGSTANYDTVKQKLVTKYRQVSRLEDGDLQNIFHATKKPGESYEIFEVRLQVLASQWQDATDGNRQALVRARFLDILEPASRQKVNIQFGHEAGVVEFQKIVDFVSTLEAVQRSKAAAKAATIPPREVVTEMATKVAVPPVDELRGGSSGARAKDIANQKARKCNYCKRPGHLAADCWQKRGLCFKCHQAGHFTNVCPNPVVVKHPVEKEESPGRQQCPVCRTWGHAPWQCDLLWQRMLALLWGLTYSIDRIIVLSTSFAPQHHHVVNWFYR